MSTFYFSLNVYLISKNIKFQYHVLFDVIILVIIKINTASKYNQSCQNLI